MNHTSTLRHAAASVAALAITLSFAHSSLLHAADGAPQPPTAAIAAAAQLEDAFSYVAEKARPAVVVITNIQYEGQQQLMQGPQEFEEYFGPWFRPSRRSPRRPSRRSLMPANTGSGAIISSEGHIITNCHVIDNCEYLKVKLADGTEFDNQKNPDDVKIIGKDEESDLAIIQIANGKRKDFQPLSFADAAKLRVGQWAIAVGAPHQLEQSVTIGTISQIGRYNMGVSTFDNYIQTDAAINPGNSGGPLLNIRGEIIGINQFIQTDGMGKGNIGLGFAISSDLASRIADALIRDGEVSRPYIGIAMQNLTPELKRQFNAENGVLIAQVLKGEAAEKAGLRSGDIITAINGKTINDSHDLLTAITNYKPGDTLTLHLLRDDKQLDIKVIAGKRDLADNSFKGSSRKPANKAEQQLSKLGLLLETEDDTVYIKAIDEDGAVANANARSGNRLQPGDAIIEVNRHQVNSIRDVKEALKDTHNNSVVLLIERSIRNREPKRFYVAIPLN